MRSHILNNICEKLVGTRGGGGGEWYSTAQNATSERARTLAFGFLACSLENLYFQYDEIISTSKLPFHSKLGCKDQESIQSSTTPDPGYQWESDKLTEDTTNESQEVSPFPAGDHEAHINRRAQNIANTRQNKNIKDPQKKYRLGTVSKIFYWRA